uniref:MULE transposase domain-containing protein n=1 Tax=Fagus sylvatica TaxID=28930 RepID=A0A2N9J2B3_FAGSY
MVAECGAPSTSMVYYLIPGGNLGQGLRLITEDEKVLYMCELHVAWSTDRITLYVEGGMEPLQVVGLDGIVGNEGGVDHESVVSECGFGDVVDEGDEGDELNKLVCYDWMDDRLEGADFTDDIFGGNEDDNAVPGEVGGNEGNNSTYEVEGNGWNNASDAQQSMQPEVGSNGENNAQPGVGSNGGNNAQPAMGINRIRIRQYAPSITRPNQPNVQAANWTEPDIEDYEINSGAISHDEDPRDRHPEFNQQTDMRKPEPIIGLDGCHLKGRFGGQLLAVTARDENDNIFLVTLAIMEQEFNNLSESFNAMILPARDKPILLMLEWIRVRLMTRLHTKRIGMEKYGGSIYPNIQDKLEKLEMESKSFCAMPSGITCKHGVAAIYKNREHPEDYLHNCYLKEAYLNVYSEIIHPMPGQDEWIKTGHLPPQPPHIIRPLGRPKKLRRRNPDEPRKPNKPISVRDSTCRSAGKVAGRGAGRGRGVSSSASRGATSGVGRGSISGQASGAAVQNVGEKSTRGGSSSKPPKLPVVGGKGRWQFLRNNAVFKKQ